MKTKILLPTIALLFAPLAGAETTLASFDGAVPTTRGWEVVGGLPLTVVEDGGHKAIQFKDESGTDFVGLVYELTEEQATEMVSKGCTFVARFRHVTNGENGSTFRLLLRIPGYGSVQLAAYTDLMEGTGRLSSYDSVAKESVGFYLPGSSKTYVTIKAVFRPGATIEAPGSVEVSLDDKPAFTIGLARAISPHARIEIGGFGGGPAARTGLDFVSEFKLTTP